MEILHTGKGRWTVGEMAADLGSRGEGPGGWLKRHLITERLEQAVDAVLLRCVAESIARKAVGVVQRSPAGAAERGRQAGALGVNYAVTAVGCADAFLRLMQAQADLEEARGSEGEEAAFLEREEREAGFVAAFVEQGRLARVELK